jgi:hypothetical protein
MTASTHWKAGYGDMIGIGIVDPLRVARSALLTEFG